MQGGGEQHTVYWDSGDVNKKRGTFSVVVIQKYFQKIYYRTE